MNYLGEKQRLIQNGTGTLTMRLKDLRGLYSDKMSGSGVCDWSGEKIFVMGLALKFDKSTQSYGLCDGYDYDPLDLYCMGECLFEYLNSVNVRGYVPEDFLHGSVIRLFGFHLKSLGYELKSVGNSELTYTCWFNLLFVNLYFLLHNKIMIIKNDGFASFRLNLYVYEEEELLHDLIDLKDRVFVRLEQFIKVQIQKRGMSIVNNTYTGFDTEWVHERRDMNKLLSVQTSVQRRTILRIPSPVPFNIGYIHPLTSEISDTFSNKVGLSKPYKDEFVKNPSYVNQVSRKMFKGEKYDELNILNQSIKMSIQRIRLTSFSVIDVFYSKLIDFLKSIRGRGDIPNSSEFDWYLDTKRNQYVFLFPITSIDSKIEFPNDSFNFSDLLSLSSSCGGIGSTDLSSLEQTLLNYLGCTGGCGEGLSFTKDSILNVFKGGFFNDPSLVNNFLIILSIFTKLGIKNQHLKTLDWVHKALGKSVSRVKLILSDGSFTYLSLVNNNYIVSHYNSGDLSMLSDFDSIKNQLSIVAKSFITLGKPLKFPTTHVHIRDTILLVPGNMGALKAIGNLYTETSSLTNSKPGKLDVAIEDIECMDKFLERDRQGFIEYALRDSEIVVKHAVAMEVFNKSVYQHGVPTTLSSIGRNYVGTQWSKNFDRFLPYQISGDFLMGDVNSIQTPKGLFATRDVGVHMSYYIANYKGGRNESFMYGTDTETKWFDYDLVSAYTTGMTDLPLPDYYKAQLIQSNILDWSDKQLMGGYLIADCEFSFPSDTKYPSIPCYVDKTTTVYPLNGNAFLTGPELLLAKKQGAKLTIKSAFYTHPKSKFDPVSSKQRIIRPFFKILKDIQAFRRTHPKGTLLNLMYKEIGNGIYGNVCRGISNKMNYDSLTKKSFRVTATNLSNPLLASWTTAFIRSVIGECLHNIQKLGGKVVSVTTDGFITDIEDLENKLLELPQDCTTLLRKYRDLRYKLSSTCEALEVKYKGEGIISWTTRGQFGIGNEISASTGFQRKMFNRQELINIFKDTLASTNKTFEYTWESLRSAKDIFTKGGNMVKVMKDQTFRMLYDNRRQVINNGKHFVDSSKVLLDSKPLNDSSHCKTLRFLSKFPITLPYNKNNVIKSKALYRSKIEVGVRNFIKAFYSTNQTFGLSGYEFKGAKDILTFISGHSPTKDVKLSLSAVSRLKSRRMIWRPVPHTVENLGLCAYIKFHYPNFNDELFLKRKPI